MKAAVGLSPLLFWIFAYLACFLVNASPVELDHSPASLQRVGAIVKDVDGETIVFRTSDNQSVPQGLASDGSGSGFDAPAIVWIIFLSSVGIPLALGGITGWRLTTGTGMGLAAAVCSWAAFINTVNEVGIPDIVLTLIVIAFFAIGFIFGLFEIGRIAGLGSLGIMGGFAFGIRIILMKSDLLVPVYFVNWLLIALAGAAGGFLMLFRQRMAITLCSASAGIFLLSLAIDLVFNKQNGLSRGLRFLFDRNTSHLVDILTNGYNAPLGTQINLGVSLALTPLLAFGQHKFFPRPFSPNTDDDDFQDIFEEQKPAGAK